jgi:hypothetical protein
MLAHRADARRSARPVREVVAIDARDHDGRPP